MSTARTWESLLDDQVRAYYGDFAEPALVERLMTVRDPERRAEALDGAFLKAERWVLDALCDELDWEADPNGLGIGDPVDDPRFSQWFNEMLEENVNYALRQEA